MLELIVGTVGCDIYFIPNEGKELAFGTPRKIALESNGEQKRTRGLVDAAPTVVDWDGDGKPDLIVSDDEGQVMQFRNLRRKTEPNPAAQRPSLQNHPVDRCGD